MRLYIANKNYSSWSLRPWIAMVVKGVKFEETLVPFLPDGPNPKFAKFSPTARVPVLEDGKIKVWESLAILEYLAEKYPARGFWPENRADRAHARSIANEMHAGFRALREAAPMNMRRPVKPLALTPQVRNDVARIESIFDSCLRKSRGPFLFGEFTNADAMFAPVVNRMEKYALSAHPAVRRYSQAMKSLPAWMKWEKAALAETAVVPQDEV
jgi:glutathione S-transferase